MLAIDTNVLVYAHREETPYHERSLSRLRTLVEGAIPWALPVFCIAEFCRVVTHPRVFKPPTKLDLALTVLSRVIESPAARVISPGPNYPSLYETLSREANGCGNLAFDVQIASVCLEHGVRQIITTDRDFARFSAMDALYL